MKLLYSFFALVLFFSLPLQAVQYAVYSISSGEVEPLQEAEDHELFSHLDRLFASPLTILKNLPDHDVFLKNLDECREKSCLLTRKQGREDYRKKFTSATAKAFNTLFPNKDKEYIITCYASAHAFSEAIILSHLCFTYDYHNLTINFIDPLYEEVNECKKVGSSLIQWLKTIAPASHAHFNFYTKAQDYFNDFHATPIHLNIVLDPENYTQFIKEDASIMYRTLDDHSMWASLSSITFRFQKNPSVYSLYSSKKALEKKEALPNFNNFLLGSSSDNKPLKKNYYIKKPDAKNCLIC